MEIEKIIDKINRGAVEYQKEHVFHTFFDFLFEDLDEIKNHSDGLADSLSFAITQLKMVRHLALMKGDEKILTLCNAALDSPLITKYDKEK